MKILFYLLSSSLNPDGTRVFSFLIQKISLTANVSRNTFLEQYKFTSDDEFEMFVEILFFFLKMLGGQSGVRFLWYLSYCYLILS